MGDRTDAVFAGTLMLNIANAFMEIGMLDNAMLIFEQAEEIYKQYVEQDDYLLAGLHNNYSLCLLEKGNLDRAEAYMKSALEIIKKYPENYIDKAVTYQNLASVAMKRNEIKMSRELLHRAYQILESYGDGESYHAGTLLANLGYSDVGLGIYRDALKHYMRAADIIYKYTGESPFYFKILDNIKILK